MSCRKTCRWGHHLTRVVKISLNILDPRRFRGVSALKRVIAIQIYSNLWPFSTLA